MKRGSVHPILTPTQARFLQGAARRAMRECDVGDERRTWTGAYRALSVAIQEMRTGAAALSSNHDKKREAEGLREALQQIADGAEGLDPFRWNDVIRIARAALASPGAAGEETHKP